MTRTRTFALATVATVAVSACVIALSARAEAKSTAPAAQPAAPTQTVQLVPAREVSTAAKEELTGTLQPAKALQLGFEVPGRLARILVRKGAPVAEGQTIAQLDPEIVDAQVAQAEAAVKAAEAQSAVASDTARRQEELQQKGSISEWQGKSSAGQAAAAQAQLLAAKAQLAQARANRRRHDLRAPFAGTLIDAPDQVGATVTPGTPLFTLEQLDALTLKVTVPESARGQLKAGNKVHIDGIGTSISTDDAQVRAVIPSADASTRRVPVEITVPNKDARFTAHTLARAQLALGAPQAAVAIPSTALASMGGDHVYVLAQDGSVRRVNVNVLDRGVREVVLKPSEPLTQVVNFPAVDLAEGTRVSVK